MVAIDPRSLLSRAVSVFRTNYNRCFGDPLPGRSVRLGRSSSSLAEKTRARAALSVQKRRKQALVNRKRCDLLARRNTTIIIPGGFPKDPPGREIPLQCEARGPEDDYESMPVDCDNTNKSQAGPSAQEQQGKQSKSNTADDEPFLREYNSLMYDRTLRKGWFEATMSSERAKKETPQRKARFEREAEEVDRLWNMRESQRRKEEERTDNWKDKRLAQLEKEKNLAQSELAREKIQRQHSRLQRVFRQQEQRHKDAERWKRRLEKGANQAAEREGNLLQENAMLRDNLLVKENALRRACDERENAKQEMGEERAQRLYAEETVRRWKELMEQYFPGGQPHPQTDRTFSLQAQFQLYETKWAVLRSGVDVDGSEVHRLFFHQIPWPVINMSLINPTQIQPEHIQKFIMHPHRVPPDAQGKRANKRQRVKDELMKWHSDKFNSIVLSKVRKEDKAAAAEAAEMITRVLTDMLR